MISSNQKTLDQMKELAERNIANGDWGDELTIPGFPKGDIPMAPEEREVSNAVSQTLAKQGDKKLPKK